MAGSAGIFLALLVRHLDGKYGAGACKYKYSQIPAKYISNTSFEAYYLLPTTQDTLQIQPNTYVFALWPNTVNTYFPARVRQ